MDDSHDRSALANFRQFFLRGLVILLPSVLTIWILLAAYNFVSVRIAEPINRGVREIVARITTYPQVTDDELQKHEGSLNTNAQAAFKAASYSRDWLRLHLRRKLLQEQWGQHGLLLDLIGLLIACLLIYLIGRLVGSFIGARLLRYFEQLLNRVPGIKQIYPHVKQVTDFLVGGNNKALKFNKVVAVQYPRKGLWSVGLVTGNTMRTIQDGVSKSCVTVFVPSSPTPFTGYVITVPEEDTMDLGITIEEALRFAVSAGVIVPPSQQIPAASPVEQLAAPNSERAAAS